MSQVVFSTLKKDASVKPLRDLQITCHRCREEFSRLLPPFSFRPNYFPGSVLLYTLSDCWMYVSTSTMLIGLWKLWWYTTCFHRCVLDKEKLERGNLSCEHMSSVLPFPGPGNGIFVSGIFLGELACFLNFLRLKIPTTC